MLDFQLAVGKAKRAQQFDAADLKPDQIVGIVDNAHLVGFSIAHADFGGDWHRGLSIDEAVEQVG